MPDVRSLRSNGLCLLYHCGCGGCLRVRQISPKISPTLCVFGWVWMILVPTSAPNSTILVGISDQKPSGTAANRVDCCCCFKVAERTLEDPQGCCCCCLPQKAGEFKMVSSKTWDRSSTIIDHHYLNHITISLFHIIAVIAFLLTHYFLGGSSNTAEKPPKGNQHFANAVGEAQAFRGGLIKKGWGSCDSESRSILRMWFDMIWQYLTGFVEPLCLFGFICPFVWIYCTVVVWCCLFLFVCLDILRPSTGALGEWYGIQS